MASYTSAISGEWDDSNTWTESGWPSAAGDTATITHTVTYSISADVELGAITINDGGTLSFNPSADTLMILGDEWLAVNSGGTLSLGTSADIISKEYTSELYWNCTGEATAGIDLNGTGAINIFGDPDYYGTDEETFLDGDGDGTANITTLDDMSSKWNIGDELIIHKNDTYSSYDSDITQTTIVSISGNTITCNDTISSDFKSKGIIVNVTRNVIIGKLNYTPDIGNENTNRFAISCDNSGNEKFNISDCTIAGIYYIRYLNNTNYGKITRSVIRNGLYAINNSNYVQVDGGIFLTMTYSTFTANSSNFDGTKFVNCQGASNYNLRLCSFNNIYAFSTQTYLTISYKCTTTNSHINGVAIPYNSCADVESRDCYFYNNYYGTGQLNAENLYINCITGKDEDGNTKSNMYDYYFHNFYEHFINCVWPASPNYLYRNLSSYQGIMYHEHFNQTLNDHRAIAAFHNSIKTDADGTGDNPTRRSGGNSTVFEIETLSNLESNNSNPTPILENQIWVGAGYTKTFRYYIQTDYVSLPSSEIYLTAEYLGSASNANISDVTSTQSISTRSNQSDWSQYVEVTLTQQQAGWVRLKLHVAGYESGKYIWVDPMVEVS